MGKIRDAGVFPLLTQTLHHARDACPSNACPSNALVVDPIREIVSRATPASVVALVMDPPLTRASDASALGGRNHRRKCDIL